MEGPFRLAPSAARFRVVQIGTDRRPRCSVCWQDKAGHWHQVPQEWESTIPPLLEVYAAIREQTAQL